MSSGIRLRKEKVPEIAHRMEPLVSGSGPPAPWQEPARRAGRWLFPRTNEVSGLNFFLVLGALNFSYWKLGRDEITTWGIRPTGSPPVRDVFGLCWCLRGCSKDWFRASNLSGISREEVQEVFRDPATGRCEIPMLSARQRKLDELGSGLLEMAERQDTEPTFQALLEQSESVEGVVQSLERWFPFSFGDPLRKLSQLLLKIMLDRRDRNNPQGDVETSDTYEQLLSLEGADQIKAQPDYMLPLFCLKTGLWDVDPWVEPFFSQHRQLPWGHPLERSIRELTVRTVDRLADQISSNVENLLGRIDSIMWQTAVEGCFPVDCEDCAFNLDCEAVQGDINRLSWHHHLTRTPSY